MGELFEVLGALRFTPLQACPQELRGQVVRLQSVDGAAFQLPAEAACISGRVRRLAARDGIAKEIEVPLKKTTVSKVVDYMKHHRDTPEGELVTPLPSDDLAQCGVARWDAKFVECDKLVLFDLNLAASLMDMAGLFFLTSAKAAILFKGKSSDHLRKQFNLLNDLPRREEETMSRELHAAGRAHLEDAAAEIAQLAVTLQATAAAAEKHGCLEATRSKSGAPAVDLRSWRHATWRAAVLLDWRQLGVAPDEVCGDRDLLLAALMSSGGMALQYASPALRGDRDLVLEATKYTGRAFREAAEELRGDRAFVLEAVARHPAALFGAADSLRGDRDLLLEAARRGHGAALQAAASPLQRDRELLLELVALDAQVLRYAAEELRGDRDFVLQAVARSGRALRYASPALQADREVVAAALGEDSVAAFFAHASRRDDLGIELPWDSRGQLQDPAAMPGVLQSVVPVGGPRIVAPDIGYWPHCTKLQKSVQFSAMSVMVGNMGQANYVAANSYLDKLPFQQRPYIEATTLMWGAVGHIGMRWKAFASQDFLNATPDALLSISEASMVLQATCCRLDTPEWYCASLFDAQGRDLMVAVTAGAGKGGGYKPSETQVSPQWRADGLGRGFLLGKDLEDSRAPRAIVAPGVAPLGGWPGLRRGGAEGSSIVAVAAAAQKRRYELELGARVKLTGLMSKNGTTGLLTKCFSDGKWKVRLEDGTGNALLKACYLQVISSAEDVKRTSFAPSSSLDPRRQRQSA